jgi:hypothetical protein
MPGKHVDGMLRADRVCPFRYRAHMKTYKHALALIACAFTVSVSHAATVDVKFDGNIFEGSGYQNVFIKATDTSLMYVSAGRFQGTASNLVGVPPSIFVDGLSDLFMYCYDIYQEISGGQTVKSYTINMNGETARTLDFLGAVNQVMNTGKPVYDPYAWLHPVSGSQGAAIQLGIWESKYESGASWDFATGNFTATGLDADTTKWWTSFKGAINSSDSLDGRYVMVLENPYVQDMIVGDPPTVAEPGSLVLLGLGFGGLGFIRRRRGVRA